MDDVLPIWICCVCRADFGSTIWPLVTVMDVYVSNRAASTVRGFDLEGKILCHFDCALRYICDEWLDEYNQSLN